MDEKDSFNWEEMRKENLCWAGCDSLEDAIKGCNNLEELFCLWQTAQIYETDYKSSFPNLSLAKCLKLPSSDEFKRSFCSSFCPDGFLTEEEKSKGKSNVPILFICRESNISGNIDNRTLKLKSEDKQIFWLREVVKCKKEDPPGYFQGNKSLSTTEKGAQTRYYNCLLNLLDCFKNNEKLVGKDEKLINKEKELSDCAYLNINKRGGFASCDQSRLAVYAERYQMFIQKEIRIIQPEHIVICGELNNGALRKAMESILQACDYHEYWVYPKHPSRYTKKTFESTDKKTII